MPSPVPTPVAAALGLVPTVLSGVRSLPGRAAQMPILAISTALATLDHARREYDDLAARGERLLARLRGTSFDELEDRIEDRLQGTPLAKPYDAVEDALEDAGEAVTRVATRTAETARARVQGGTRAAAGTVSDLSEKAAQRAEQAADTTERAAQKAAGTAEKTTRKTAEKTAGTAEKPAKAADKAAKATRKAAARVDKAADKVADKADKATEKAAGKVEQQAGRAEALPEEEQPKGEATPKAPTAEDAAGPVETAATADVVATVERVVEQADAPEVVEHDDLPLPDYDHMTLGSLRGRLRSLSTEELVQVRDYEKAHANRLPVVTMLDNRIAKLATDPGGTPGGGDDPTNPAQPRATGSTGPNSSSAS